MDDVAGAIADPVRREILAMLHRSPLSAGQIAERFTISRPAVSRHLRVLRECGLVRDELVGRNRIYVLDPGPLADLAGWLGQFARPLGLEQRLDALETEVYRLRRERRTSRTTASDLREEGTA